MSEPTDLQNKISARAKVISITSRNTCGTFIIGLREVYSRSSRYRSQRAWPDHWSGRIRRRRIMRLGVSRGLDTTATLEHGPGVYVVMYVLSVWFRCTLQWAGPGQEWPQVDSGAWTELVDSFCVGRYRQTTCLSRWVAWSRLGQCNCCNTVPFYHVSSSTS